MILLCGLSEAVTAEAAAPPGAATRLRDIRRAADIRRGAAAPAILLRSAGPGPHPTALRPALLIALQLAALSLARIAVLYRLWRIRAAALRNMQARTELP
jgi:hypothetical protein